MVEIGKEVEKALVQVMNDFLKALKEKKDSAFQNQPIVLDEVIISVSLVGCNSQTKKMFRQDNLPFIKFVNPLDPEKIDVRIS
jgi:hypothetical protein